MTDTPDPRENPAPIRVNDRVRDLSRFGPGGVVVGVCHPWVWVVWDEYPSGQKPSTHHEGLVRKVEFP